MEQSSYPGGADRVADASHPDVSELQLLPHERGPAKFFHGRESERRTFRDLCQKAMKQSKHWREQGSTFIIQGPPGVGKTALMVELWEEAQKEKWNVVRISPSMLHSPHTLAEKVGLKYVSHVTKGVGGSATIVSGERTWQIDARQSVTKLLEVAGKRKRGILLVIDEAQRMARMVGNTEVEDTLDAIHNGHVGRPVVLLAGGLAHTSEAFADLGISRVYQSYRINLGHLPADAERAVIQDWLVKAGGAPESDVGPWVDAIAAHTDGWPEHIISFAEPASQLLQHTGGRMIEEGLERVLAEGEKRKAVYYDDRCARLDPDDLALFGALITVDGKAGEWAKPRLDRVFELIDRGNRQPATEVVDTAIQKGVLSRQAPGLYRIPIPSMADYLQGKFDAYKAMHPDIAPHIESAVRKALRPQWRLGLGHEGSDTPETPGLA